MQVPAPSVASFFIRLPMAFRLNAGEEEAKQLCLDRKSCDSVTSPLRTASCDHCGAKGWDVLG